MPVRVVVLVMAALAAASAGHASSLRAGAVIETEYAVSTADGRAQKAELIVTPELDWRGPWGISGYASARLRADAFDRLKPGEPDQPTASAASRRRLLSDRTEAELREAYLDMRLGPAFLRLGKQETVWGQADGLKVLDVVNPQSFREFVLDDFDDSRIPLWTAKWEVPAGPGLLQMVWIPDRTYNDLPGSEDLFALTSPQLVPQPAPGTSVTVRPPQRPQRFFADSDAGVRWSAFLGGWDLTLSYLYHYRDNPVPFRRTGPAGATIEQRYRRSNLVGTTFSSAFGAFTVRGEAGYSTDRFFLAADPADADGVVETEELSYVLGLDWQGPDDLFVSGQLFQSLLGTASSRVTRPALQTDATLLVRQQYWHDTLTAEVLVTHNLDLHDGLVEPRLAWDYQSNVTLSLGGAVFHGPERGRFGQFDDLDRLTLAVEIGI